MRLCTISCEILQDVLDLKVHNEEDFQLLPCQIQVQVEFIIPQIFQFIDMSTKTCMHNTQ